MVQHCRGGLEGSFDLDFHTIPYHGDEALIEKHYVSKRSRRQKGVLAFLVRDAGTRSCAWANATVARDAQNDEVLRFVEAWKARTGQLPAELVFDSRLTTYANLARLDAMGIGFLTLRRRSARLVDALLAEPPEKWRRVSLTNVARRFRTPRILEQTVRLGDCPDPVRQIAVRDLGHDRPTLLIANQLDASPRELIDRYARRMVIENAIADAIDFFHMDALSAVVPMKVDVDVQLTVMASSLYRILARRIGNRCETRKPAQLFRKSSSTPPPPWTSPKARSSSATAGAPTTRSWPTQDCSRRPKGSRGSTVGRCASAPSEQVS